MMHEGPHYYVVAYDRRTTRQRQLIEVRPRLRERVALALGIEPWEWGEIALGADQVRTLAGIMDFAPDLERYLYHFEVMRNDG